MEIPKRVKTTVDSLRKGRNKYIAVMKKRNNYYAYESTSIWDKDEKKVKSKMLYLGKIDDEGTFIPAKKRSGSLVEHLTSSFPKQIRDKISSLSEIYADISVSKIEDNTVYLNFINKRGEKKFLGTLAEDGTFLNKSKEVETENKEYELGDVDKKILTCLSMNARMPLSRLAKMVGISQKSTYYRVRSLEKKFDIKYLCEIDIANLGYISYLVFVKFENMPDLDTLKIEIKNNIKIQFAALLKGSYDLMFYLIDRDPLQADSNLFFFRRKDIFKDCNSTWHLVPFDTSYSFIPLRQEFLEDILKSGERGGGDGRAFKINISHKELALIRELNMNGVENFSSVDKKFNWSEGTSRYVYHKLKERNIVLRCTINLAVRARYVALILRETINAYKLGKSLEIISNDIIETKSTDGIINRYVLEGIVGAPAGVVYFLQVRYDGELEKVKKHLENISEGAIFKSLVITDILVGSLCYRRFDGTYSRVYENLVELYGGKVKSRVNYDSA